MPSVSVAAARAVVPPPAIAATAKAAAASAISGRLVLIADLLDVVVRIDRITVEITRPALRVEVRGPVETCVTPGPRRPAGPLRGAGVPAVGDDRGRHA
ncbi:hypothetical protein GCM10009530_75750 [Microbispora corallina]|uniref:Uncharacterized protein n=1 Tax=Microbispora corallina TaxID=83302 RepID=A0ABQ4G003_9ACTN|nr:hypothetical protein Mco01_33820 [Microbispora corallina]